MPPRHENVSLRQNQASNVRPHSHATEQDTSNLDHTEPAQSELGDKRISVLVGSSILQLPMWGFAMSYGVFQEYYHDNWTLQGSRNVTGVIGTTSNGVIYLSIPFLFALFTKRWARRRQSAALCGTALTCASFIISSFSRSAWQLVLAHGVLAGIGCALMYSPTTLSLGEWFDSSHGTVNRAVAYGVTLSCKNIVGSAGPFLFRGLLDRYGFRTTLRIWAAVVAGTSMSAILLIPTHPSKLSPSSQRTRKISWRFLNHRTFYIYTFAIILQSCGYGIPQTYLGQYAHEVTLLSQRWATILLALFNIPGILSSFFFGYLSDNKHLSLSASTVTAISAGGSGLSAFIFWGLSLKNSITLIILFSITFGFFSSGYSSTWGGVLNEMEQEAGQWNEAIDTGLIYGLLNGARGIGYISGGLASIQLLQARSMSSAGAFAYGTSYGPLIVFTGLSSVLGGWGLLWNWEWKAGVYSLRDGLVLLYIQLKRTAGKCV